MPHVTIRSEQDAVLKNTCFNKLQVFIKSAVLTKYKIHYNDVVLLKKKEYRSNKICRFMTVMSMKKLQIHKSYSFTTKELNTDITNYILINFANF